MALFASWLYGASYAWLHLAALKSLSVASMLQGAVGIGILLYGVMAISRAFAINGVPLAHSLHSAAGGQPQWFSEVLAVAGALCLAASGIALFWIWYHARPRSFRYWDSLCVAAVLGAPILVYEAVKTLAGFDLFGVVVAVIHL